MKTILIRSAMFAILGFLAGAAVIPFQSDLLNSTLSEAGVSEPISIPVLTVLTGIQIAIASFVLSLLGMLAASKVNLKLFTPFTRKTVIGSVLAGMTGSVITILADVYLFMPHMPQLDQVDVAWWKGLLGGMLYGGIFEEVALRLFFMSVIVWLSAKVMKKPAIPNYVYWTAIIVSTLVFAAAHLPATAAVFGELTPLLVTRAFVMNGLLSIVFGYLYWKKGLVYAIIAHMSAHVMLFGIVKGFIAWLIGA